MKITANTRTVFRFPTGLIANGLTAGIIRRKLKKEGIILTGKQTARLIKELKRYKKTHPDWNLVEVDSPTGDTVKVKL
jgi:hypothetical protein